MLDTRDNPSWERHEAIRQIERHGRASRKRQSGYHRRSLAETAVRRLKTAFGERLKKRARPNQKVEGALRCKLLNWFVPLGMPLSLSI